MNRANQIILVSLLNLNREHIYTEGGVLFISSRIIVVDLLKHRVPIKQITGFLMYRAHKVLESCQDGFALRLFKLENKVSILKSYCITLLEKVLVFS